MEHTGREIHAMIDRLDRKKHDPRPRKLKSRKRALCCWRCDYTWQYYGRQLPKRCARCRSPYWQTPRTHPQRRAKRFGPALAGPPDHP